MGEEEVVRSASVCKVNRPSTIFPPPTHGMAQVGEAHFYQPEGDLRAQEHWAAGRLAWVRPSRRDQI